MSFAVQLRSRDDISCSVLFGKSYKTIPGKLGDVLLFRDSQLIIYQIMQRKKARAYVFKTIKGDYNIPGVFPSVHLLAEASTKGRVERLENVLKLILRYGLDPSRIDDKFYYFVNYQLEKKMFYIDKILNKLKSDYV